MLGHSFPQPFEYRVDDFIYPIGAMGLANFFDKKRGLLYAPYLFGGLAFFEYGIESKHDFGDIIAYGLGTLTAVGILSKFNSKTNKNNASY